MRKGKRKKKVKLSKREFICKQISRGNKKVKISKKLKPKEDMILITDNLLRNRVADKKGVILGFVQATYGIYYYIKVDRKIGVYHIDEFMIIK